MKLTSNRVLVSPMEAPKKIGAIDLPGEIIESEPLQQGTVMEIGPDVTEVRTLHQVLYKRIDASKISINGENLHLLRESEIVAIL